MAVIVEKDRAGHPIFKSITFPPTQEERAAAIRLDGLLQRRVPEIETELTQKGLLLPAEIGEHVSKTGNVELWYELGIRLREIADDEALVKPKERKWLWEAVKTYATSRIVRIDRGPSRSHMEYCYRIAGFTRKFVERFNWDDWVYLLDSKSFRQEPRADQWIRERNAKLSKLSRTELRRMVRQINAEFKNKDTSVFDDDELFKRYDQHLKNACLQTR